MEGRPVIARDREPKGSLSARLLLLIFVMLAAGILIAGFLFYSNYEKNYRMQVEQQISAIADLKAGEIAQWRKERISDANQLFSNPAFASLVQRYFDHTDDSQTKEQLRSWLSRFQVYDQYEKVFLLDTQGAGRIFIPDTVEPVPRHIVEDADRALQSGAVTILDLELDEGDPQPHMLILIPIFAEKDNAPLGVVVLRIDPYQYLYPLISRWPTPSTTAETLIVRRDGNDTLFLNELKFQKDTALKLRIPLEQKDVPAVKAALGEEGIVEGRDYRGQNVIADIRRIPDSPWFMVARIDTSEVYAPVTQVLWLIIALVGALLIGAGAGVGLIWRLQNIRVYRERAEIADALKVSEEKYRLIIDYSLDMIYTLDADGKFLFVSPASTRIMGYEPLELQGHTFQSFVHPADVSAVEYALKDFIETGKFTPGLEYRTKHASGDWRWHTTSGNRVLDEKGSFLYFVGITHDVTERRGIAESLKSLTLRYEAILAAVPDIIMEVDENKVYTWANRSATEFFGEEVIGKEAAIYFEGEQHTYNTVQPLFEGDENVIYVESWQRRRDGEKRLLAWWCRVLKDNDGKVIGALSSAQDITHRKMAEEQLVHLHQQNELILSTVAEGIIGLDLQGNHTFANPAAANMLGYQVEDLISRTSHSTWHHTRADGSPYPQEECEIYAAFRDGEMHHVYTEVFWRKDGTSFPVEYTSTPVNEQDGLVGAVVTFADITERKLAEENLLKSYESVKKTLNDAINTMVKIVETRDPYTSGHQQRVADLATTVAREMKLDDSRVDQLRTAAVLHDIGKMYIPSDILSKPGRLSDIEFSLIKTHAQSGYDIVKGMDLPGVVAQVILQHHERIDGSGYPDGLKGEDTLLEAKILAVADVIEAMAADRPYRPALGIAKALEEISKNKGRLYDPDVADACLEIFNSGKFEFR